MDYLIAEDYAKRARKALETEFGATAVVGFQHKTNAIGLQLMVNLTAAASPEAAREALVKEWAMSCHRYGLKQEDLERGIYYNGKVLPIVGINHNSRKAPLMAADDTGRIMRYPISYLGPVVTPKVVTPVALTVTPTPPPLPPSVMSLGDILAAAGKCRDEDKVDLDDVFTVKAPIPAKTAKPVRSTAFDDVEDAW